MSVDYSESDNVADMLTDVGPDCSYWQQYKGKRYPKCNGGRGCRKCWAIWTEAQRKLAERWSRERNRVS